MAIIQWKDNLSVNISEIDEQHKMLVTMINDLHDAMKLGKGKDALGDILNNLATYTVGHFGTEEKYFEQFDYPDTLSHRKEHQAFTEKVTGFIGSFNDGKAVLSMDVMSFLKDWLINHIQGSDKQYGPFLNSHGLN